jgi:hypothetical protein
MSRNRTSLCALVVAVTAAASIATPVASADRGKKVDAPALLWKTYPLAPSAKTVKADPQPKAATPPDPRPKTFAPPKRRPKAVTPPKPRPKATAQTTPSGQTASYEISTEKTGTPSLLLLAVFLGGLLTVAGAMLVGWRLVPTRHRRRGPSTEAAVLGTDGELLEALQPKPQPRALPKLVVAEAAPTLPETRRRIIESRPSPEAARPQTLAVESAVARCEIRLWRGFVKSHLYAAPAGSDKEPIAFSPYFRLLDDERSSSQALQALAVLVEELEQDGWTVVSDGPAWYQHRLERY